MRPAPRSRRPATGTVPSEGVTAVSTIRPSPEKSRTSRSLGPPVDVVIKPNVPGSTPLSRIAISTPRPSYVGWSLRNSGTPVLPRGMSPASSATRGSATGAGSVTPGVALTSGGWRGVAVASEMEGQFRAPVVLDNTANLAALGELKDGALQGVQHGVYIKMSYGVGAGLILGGELFRGSAGTAGEIGHLTIDENGPVCRCGNRGCLETFVGSRALLEALAPIALSRSVQEVRGYGRQKGHLDAYRGDKLGLEFIPKARIEVDIDDLFLEEAVTAIVRAARTGRIGDGKIFILRALEFVASPPI